MWLLFGRLFTYIRQVVLWSIEGATSIAFKYPILLAYVVSVTALSALFYAAITAFFLALNLVFPSQYYELVSPIVPTNLKACFAIVLSVRFILLSLNWTLRFKSKLFNMASNSSGRS